MRQDTFENLRKMPVGTHFLIYDYDKKLVGKNVWICRIEPSYKYGADWNEARRLESLWCGLTMWDDYLETIHTEDTFVAHSFHDLEEMGGNPYILTGDEYYKFIAGKI